MRLKEGCAEHAITPLRQHNPDATKERQEMTPTLMVKEDRMTPTEISLPDAIGTVRFIGTKLVDRTWDVATALRQPRSNGMPRWTDMALYAVTEPSPWKYVLHVIGRSAVYHSIDGTCQRGAPTTVADFATSDRYQEVVACRYCAPAELDDLDDTASIRVEEDRPSVRRCADVDDLINALQDNDGNIRGLGTSLLRDAAALDPDIQAYMGAVRRL